MVCLLKLSQEKEIKEAAWDFDGNKSPESNGFNFNFIKSCWEMVKVDIVRAFKEFHFDQSLPRETNASFLTLIPKKENALGLEEFRSIFLIGCLYKTIAKVLANRMGRVLGKVVDEKQSTFFSNK